MNNLPKVVAQQRRGRASNPRLLDRKSDALLLSHRATPFHSLWKADTHYAVPAATAIHLAATDHGEFITLVTGKRPSLLMAGNNDEVYDKKPQRYAEDNVTQW